MRTPGARLAVVWLVGVLNLPAIAGPGVHMQGSRIVLETDHVVYVVGLDGQSKSFADRRTGEDYLMQRGPFMSIEQNGQWVGATAAQWVRGFLYVTFGDTGILAKVHVRAFENYLSLELTAINDHTIESIRLMDVRLNLTKYIGRSLTNCRDDEFAAALIPLNSETNTYAVVKKPAELVAHADRVIRLEGAKFAMLACPTPMLLDIIEQIEIENGLPHPTIDGVWARRSPRQRESMLYTEIHEDTVDEAIDFAKMGGFSGIVLFKHVWCATQGSYTINREYFPSGEAGLKAVSDKIHAAGLRFGLHNFELIVHKQDPLVQPVPAKGFQMYPWRRRILAADIGPNDTFIPTTTSPEGLMAASDKSMFDGRDLRIDDEIVTYGDLQTTKPYGFVDCVRGANKTRKAAHAAGTKIDNFAEFFWSYYIPDLEGELFETVMRNEAAVLDRFDVDYFYPDASGANISRSATLPRWYARGQSNLRRYHNTRREVLFTHTAVSNHAWHVMTQGNQCDCVQNGIHEHFDLITLGEVPYMVADLQPYDFGWFCAFTHSATGPATRPREIEYAWSKALAYGASVSFNVTMNVLRNHGRMREILGRIKLWEELKLADHFPESVRAQMKKPGAEFALVRKAPDERHRTATDFGLEGLGKWHIEPVSYAPVQYVTRVDGEQNVWAFGNAHPTQRLRAIIEPMAELAEYGDSENVVLIGPGPLNLATTGVGPLWGPRQSAGVEIGLVRSNEASPGGRESFEIHAVNTGDGPDGWGCAEVLFDGVKDLTSHRALGTWVKGDGSRAYLHFTIEAGRRVVRDFYVRLDFEGWKYVTMAEPAGGEVYDFKFPFSNYWALGIMAYESIDRVYVFLTNLPSGGSARVRFGRLEALKETPRSLRNPGLSVNGKSVIFPVTIEPNCYLEYEGDRRVRVFDPDGHTKAEVEPKGPTPTIHRGDNQVTFSCDHGEESGQSAKVTLITRGKALQ